MANDPFDLGMDEWINNADELQGSEEPRKKKMRLSLSHHEGASTYRMLKTADLLSQPMPVNFMTWQRG